MKYIFLTLIVLLFHSCKRNKKTEISINNNSGVIIDSVKITYGTENENEKYLIKNINNGDKVKTELDMNFKGIDGGYLLEVFQNKKKTEKYFGYYSNSVFKNYIYDLSIEKDTLLIKKNRIN